MTAPIDFYFDFSSPYGYFASTRIDEIAQKYGRGVMWHPILLGVVFKTTGSSPLPSIPLKGEYCWRDFERTAQFHNIEYKRPTHFPLPTQHAARAVLWLHVLRNALIPVITVMGMQFSELLAGTIVVENVFYLPGLGRLIFQAISNRDLIVVRNCVMLLAAFVVIVNFVVDVLYAVIDPRIKASDI